MAVRAHVRARVRARPAKPSLRSLLPHLPLAVLVVAYAVRFSLLSVQVHDGFGTPPYDMALFDQGIWLLSRFHAPFVTVMGRDLFGDHTAFILVLAVPLYWVYPHAQTLLVLQSCLLAAAAVPIYLLGRRLLRSTVLATALAAAYLLNPALQDGNLEQFHPESFLVLALAVGIYAAVEWRPKLFLAAAVAALLCKQDTALLVIPLALWVAWRRNRRLGLILAGSAALYMAIAFEVIIRAFLGTASFNMTRIPFGGMLGFVEAIVTKPRQVWDYATSRGRPFYLWQMGAAVGWVFVVAPEIAAVGVLTFLENELADFGYMHHINYHYSMPLVPVLLAGTVYALSRLRTAARRRAATGLVTACAFAACVVWGLAPFSEHSYPHWNPSSPKVHEIDAVLRELPPHAVVSAWYPIVSHIDHRTRVYMWPTPFAAHYWGLYRHEGERLPFAGDVQYLVLPSPLTGTDASVFSGIASRFSPVDEGGGVTLYRRIAPG